MSSPLGGHLGQNKTEAHLLRCFYWLGIHREISDSCGSCPECQFLAPGKPLLALLVPLPLVETLFERVAMDIMGLLLKSSVGYQYKSVIVNYVT